ncbi:MAG TPA: YqcC family protein [Moraxellaceae bacterium]|nr:YqcC family protein [Moraxellaceae bacterium]
MQQAEHHRAMRDLLAAVEAEMRARGLWSPVPPSPAAMASVMPFMYDTLRLHEWLQWVFLPRTLALIDAGRPLPGNCHIHPLAEHEFARLEEVDTVALLDLILQVDSLMNRG